MFAGSTPMKSLHVKLDSTTVTRLYPNTCPFAIIKPLQLHIFPILRIPSMSSNQPLSLLIPASIPSKCPTVVALKNYGHGIEEIVVKNSPVPTAKKGCSCGNSTLWLFTSDD